MPTANDLLATACMECSKRIENGEEHYLSSNRPYCASCAKKVFDDILPGARRTRRDLFATIAMAGTGAVGVAIAGGIFSAASAGRSGSGSGGRGVGRLGAYVLAGTAAAVAGIHRATFAQYAQADMAVERVVRGQRRPLIEATSLLDSVWSRRKVLAPLAGLGALAYGITWWRARPPAKHIVTLTKASAFDRTPYGINVTLESVRASRGFADPEGVTLLFNHPGSTEERVSLECSDVNTKRTTLGIAWKMTACDTASGSVTVQLARP